MGGATFANNSTSAPKASPPVNSWFVPRNAVCQDRKMSTPTARPDKMNEMSGICEMALKGRISASVTQAVGEISSMALYFSIAVRYMVLLNAQGERHSKERSEWRAPIWARQCRNHGLSRRQLGIVAFLE